MTLTRIILMGLIRRNFGKPTLEVAAVDKDYQVLLQAPLEGIIIHFCMAIQLWALLFSKKPHNQTYSVLQPSLFISRKGRRRVKECAINSQVSKPLPISKINYKTLIFPSNKEDCQILGQGFLESNSLCLNINSA